MPIQDIVCLLSLQQEAWKMCNSKVQAWYINLKAKQRIAYAVENS